jgi:hypothetical protein
VWRKLAPGEEVISNSIGQADFYRPVLKAINAGMGMANGGWVPTPPWWNQPPPGGGGGGGMFEFNPPKDKREEDQSLKNWLREQQKALAEVIRDVSKVVRQFSVDLSEGGEAVRGSLRDFRTQIKEAGGGWTKGLERQTEAIRAASDRYDALTASIDTQQQAVDAANDALAELQSAQSSFASAVAGQFTSDLFGGGLAGLDKALAGDIASRQRKDAAMASLVAQGLDPESAFFKELAAKGDVVTLEQLAAGGGGVIDYYEQQYAMRDALNAAAGMLAGEQAYGKAIADASAKATEEARIHADLVRQQTAVQEQTNRRLEALEQLFKEEHPRKTGKAVGDEINNVARNAARGRGGWGAWP